MQIPLWASLLFGVMGAFGFGGIILALLNRRWKVRDDSSAGELSYASLNLKTLAEAREQWRKDIHDAKEQYNGELLKLKNQIERLEEDNENLKATHVEMYMAIRANQEFFDTLRLRKKADGLITFSITELPPHLDLAALSPSKVFRRSKVSTQQINLRVEQGPPPT